MPRRLWVTRLSLLIFFASGFSGLAFEIVWVRLAALGVGVSIWAVSIVVASFMAGLALGSTLIGRRADRSDRALQMYAWLEVGIAVSGQAATIALQQLPQWMAVLPTPVGSLPDRVLQVLLVFLILLVPCTLMGGTLPTLTRALASPSQPSHVLGLLYGANTFGAVAAAFFTYWTLVPALGLRAATLVPAGLNLLAAAACLALAATGGTGEEPDPVEEVRAPRWLPLRDPLHRAYALAGLASMGLQIAWTRLMMAFSRPTIYLFSVVLTIFLIGIALGSFLAASWSSRTARPRTWLAIALSLVGMASLASMLWVTPVDRALDVEPLQPLLQGLAGLGGAEHYKMHLSMLSNAVRSIGLFGLPTLLMGVAFPLAARLALENQRGLGRPLGELYTANTLGGILGTLATGFWILPALGAQHTLILLAGLSVLSGLLVALGPGATRSARVAVAVGLALCTAAALLPKDTLAKRIYLPIWTRSWGVDPDDVRYFADDSYGTVAVLNAPGGPQLLVNSTMMMGVRPEGQRYAQLMGHLPTLLAGRPRKALVICFGTGMTLNALNLQPDLESITCVELSPSVLEASPQFRKWNHDALHSPKVRVVVADGRNYLLRSRERFDVITFEPPPPTAAGVVNLYTSDYYRLCREHLTEDGVVCQWVPLSLLDEPDLKMVIRAFQAVFPEALLFEGSSHDYFILGSPSPLRMSWDRLTRALENEALAANLAGIGMDSPVNLAATFMRGPRFLKDYSASAPL
ncbi:MAG: fused MFS/spermidine synthase, partial [Candidatus Eremiobacterota bacterium]